MGLFIDAWELSSCCSCEPVGALVGDAMGAFVGEPDPGGLTIRRLTVHWAMHGQGRAAITQAYTEHRHEYSPTWLSLCLRLTL